MRFRGLGKGLSADVHAEVRNLETVAVEKKRNQVLADAVEVTCSCADDDPSLDRCRAPFQMQAKLSHTGLHGSSADHNLGKERLTVFEEFPRRLDSDDEALREDRHWGNVSSDGVAH